MALIHDLRLINGVWSDTNAWDILNGSEVADTITIYGGNDQVIAGGGNDVVYDFNSYTGGPSGSDIVRGGFGNDTIFTSLDTSGNLYDGGADFDTVNFVAVGGGVNIDLQSGFAQSRATLAVSSLRSIEGVVGSGAFDYIYGDANSNMIRGYGGDDILNGRGGSDRLSGDDGYDTVIGGDGADVIDGGQGDDVLVGGRGFDQMAGNAGADDFVFTALNESVNGNLADKIFGFQHLADDIDVSRIDANALAAGDQAFRFIGGNAFNAAGQARAVLDAAHNETVLLFNTDNDTAAEMTVKLGGPVTVTALDFIL